ncbi:hypothetical protein [Burkholderia sp. D-99]|uniref:hypothetical protein n=1 Tax=Burkholderia sp. D-99 TaxID=2717316 RepID=UPI0014211379|nr:hypothetical protein [Burkholderia sp. D-99]NHV29306.1 hypothetical protein [Burkholderia sp. D-99]
MGVVHSVLAWMRDSTNASLAGWAQAIGGALAVVAAFLFPTLQSRREAKLRADDRRIATLAHAGALRLIAIECEEAIHELVGTLQLEPDSPPRHYGFPLPDHPQLGIFAEAMGDLLPRISSLLQQPALRDDQINALVAIRSCLKEARLLFDGVHSPYQEFDSKRKEQARTILDRIQTLRQEAQTAYAAIAAGG